MYLNNIYQPRQSIFHSRMGLFTQTSPDKHIEITLMHIQHRFEELHGMFVSVALISKITGMRNER